MSGALPILPKEEIGSIYRSASVPLGGGDVVGGEQIGRRRMG